MGAPLRLYSADSFVLLLTAPHLSYPYGIRAPEMLRLDFSGDLRQNTRSQRVQYLARRDWFLERIRDLYFTK